MRIVVLCVALIACGGEERSGTPGRDYTCDPSERSGAYSIVTKRLSGTCADEGTSSMISLKDSYPDPPVPDCAIVAESWSGDMCTLWRTTRCKSGSSHEDTKGTTEQNNETGSLITGTLEYNRYTDNVKQCSATHSVTLVRQGM